MAAFTLVRPGGVSAGLAATLLAWGAAVARASLVGPLPALAAASPPAIGLLIGLTIIIPTALYFLAPRVRRTLDALDLRAVTLFNLPRVPGGMLILGFGILGLLPPVFGIVAGLGDIVSGLAAARIIGHDVTFERLRTIHGIGLVDIAVALATGLVFALAGDQRMAGLATPMMALIVLWYVSMLATSHIVVLARLARS
jgi:hypothetical protein